MRAAFGEMLGRDSGCVRRTVTDFAELRVGLAWDRGALPHVTSAGRHPGTAKAARPCVPEVSRREHGGASHLIL
jgi:hypothetical protein